MVTEAEKGWAFLSHFTKKLYVESGFLTLERLDFYKIILSISCLFFLGENIDVPPCRVYSLVLMQLFHLQKTVCNNDNSPAYAPDYV